MALINKDAVLKDCLRTLKKVKVHEGIELLSYKRNRTIGIIKLSEDRFLVKENGYVIEELVIPLAKLAKILKLKIKREFPRSRKVRLFRFHDPVELDREKQKI